MRVTRKFNIYIRAIAFVLVTTFILQDIVYADPDLLFKSSSVAPRSLATSENKPEAIQRIAKAHFGRLASKNPDIMAVEDASLYLFRASRLLGLSAEETPAITGTAVDGVVKISFSDGKELIFYNPELVPSGNSPELLALFSPDKHIASDRGFGKYLREALIFPGRKKDRGPALKQPKSYEDSLKDILKMDDRLNVEIGKALNVVYNPKSRAFKNIRRIRTIELAASMLAAELKAGLIGEESLRITKKTIQKSMQFKWTNPTQKGQMRSFYRHIKKASEIKAEEDGLIQKMPRETWRTYVLPAEASAQDRDKYLESNIRDVAIYLRETIGNIGDHHPMLKKRLLELYGDIRSWKDLDTDSRGKMFNSSSKAFYAISARPKILAEPALSARLKYLADRCRSLVELSEYREEPVLAESVMARPVDLSRLGGPTVTMILSMFTMLIVGSLVFAGVVGVSGQSIALTTLSIVLTYLLVGRLVQEKYMDYYLSNTGKILNSVRDREPLEKEKVHKLFKDVLNVYKLFLARGLVKKRKELISNLILANIIPPEEMEMDSKVPDEKKRKQSHVRSDEARDLIINEVFSSNDSTIFQPALEVIIELIARYPKHYSKQFLPLLEESGKLPRFAMALVDILIKAEKGGIKMFGDIDANHFIDQGKDIIKELCDRLPQVRREVIFYLLKISEKSYKETEMVHDLLDRLGFFIATSEEFPKIAAVQVVEVISKTRAQRKQSQDERKEINVVLTGGKTMPEFLDYLTKIIDRELWKDIHIYQLCEYRSLPPEDNRSIAYFINQHLPQSLPEANRHFINGMNPDPDYVAKLEKAGGADVVVLGIGSNGRIGFNEPSDQFDKDSGSLALRKVVSQPSIGPYIMKDGYTMRLSDILKWNVILLAEGKNKADIIKKSLFGPITPQIPASRLQNKKRLKVVLDIGAMNIISPNFFVSYKKAIRSVSKLEERSRELFEESPTPQHEINRDGIIIHANKAEAKMLGYDSPEDLLGMHVWDLIYIADVDKARARILSKFTKSLNDLPEVEARYMTRDGRIIWVLIKDHQIGIEDEIETIQSTLTDITRYKVMEEELTAMKDRFKDTARLNGELSGDKNGAKTLSILGLLLLAVNIAIFTFVLSHNGFGASEADFIKLSKGLGGFVLMAGTVVSLTKNTFTDPAKTKFVEELAKLQADIELMKDGDNDITESELQRVNRELSMLEKQIGIDFKDDKEMAEFYRSLLADLHKILLELADEAQDTTVRVVSPKASGDLNEDVTQDSIDDERRKLDKAIRSLEEPEDYDAELNKTASRISVRVSALRDDVEDFFSDDTDMLERYSLMVDELEERFNDALQDNGIELTDADIAAAETVAESNAEAELVYISRPKSKNSMSVSARVKALEGAIEKLITIGVKDISELEKNMKAVGPEIIALYDKCSKSRNPNLYIRYHERLIRISGNLKALKENLMGHQEPAQPVQSTPVSIKKHPAAIPEDVYRDFSALSDIEHNANHVVSLLVNTLISQSPRQRGSTIVLAVDKSLGPTEEIRRLIHMYVTEALASAGSGSQDLKRIFDNLSIIDGEASSLPVRLNSIIEKSAGKGKEVIEKENILILTSNSNLEYFKDFEGRSFITAVNDAELKTADGKELNYYPMIELIFFSIARMVISGRESPGNYKDNLWGWYKNIPNIENLERKYFESIVYDSDGSIFRKTVILKLIPRTRQFGPDELKVTYEHIREFITKA